MPPVTKFRKELYICAVQLCVNTIWQLRQTSSMDKDTHDAFAFMRCGTYKVVDLSLDDRKL